MKDLSLVIQRVVIQPVKIYNFWLFVCVCKATVGLWSKDKWRTIKHYMKPWIVGIKLSHVCHVVDAVVLFNQHRAHCENEELRKQIWNRCKAELTVQRVHTHTHRHTHTHARTHTHTHTRTHTHTHTRTHTRTHTHRHRHTHARTHTHTDTDTHTHARTHAHTHTHTHTDTLTHAHTYRHTDTHTHTHAHKHTDTHTHTHTHTHKDEKHRGTLNWNWQLCWERD